MNISLGKTAAAAAGTASETAADQIRHRKLEDAAQKFEAMFLMQMLKPMREGVDGEADKGKDAGAGSDTMTSYGTEAMADALAKGKGMGIARQIVEKVSREYTEHSVRRG